MDETEKKRLLAYNKTLRGRWRRFWQDVHNGRVYWQHAVYRVWGTDSQGQKHYLGMEGATTPQKAMEERRNYCSYFDPRVLEYQITATIIPHSKRIGEHIGNFVSSISEDLKGSFPLSTRSGVYFVSRVATFVLLLYGIDRTPLDAYRIVAYFHLGPISSWFLALAAIVVLWRATEVVLGILLLAVGCTAWLLETMKGKAA